MIKGVPSYAAPHEVGLYLAVETERSFNEMMQSIGIEELHSFEENGVAVLEAEAALRKADFASFARAVIASHKSMRDLYDISCPEIDWLLKRVQELDENPDDLRTPVNCGRITGKGFGRCTYSILRTSDLEKYKEKLNDYERIFGFAASCHEVKPAAGVKLL